MKRLFFLFVVVFITSNFGYTQNPQWNYLDVHHYDIHLSITDISAKHIEGYADITFVSNINNLDSAWLYLSQLQVDSIQFEGTTISSYLHYNDSIVGILLPIMQSQGDTFKMKVYYNGQPILDPSGFGGFYFSSDNLYAYNIGVAFSDDPHSYGRVWFPCIDSFEHKSLYDFHITTTTPAFAVCGGTLMSKTDDTISGTTLAHWKINQKTSPYLISVAVSDYVLVADTFYSVSGDIPVHIYVRQPDSSKVAGSFANLIAMLNGFEQHFGPYSWDRVGYVGVPFNSGAMEHAMNIAYPRIVINGTLAYEYLVAHELAHSWFGNLVTCASAPEMWINEGWARFSEIVYMEIVYGTEAARNYFRKEHKDVLHKTHISDNGYRAVHGVPHDYTYSSTVYDKGGIVVHAMRNYMGDSLFFETVRAYTDYFKFKTVTSYELRDFFSVTSGIDLTDFFDAWVFRPGFATFVVDSFHVEHINPNFDVSVYFNQKLKGTTEFALSNKFEVMFLGMQFEKHIETVHIASNAEMKQFSLPFQPVAVFIDPLDKTCFATTKDNVVVKSTGVQNLTNSLSRLDVTQIGADSLQLIVRHHWVAPDGTFDPSQNIVRISDYRYWEIDGVIPVDAVIEMRLQYNRTVTTSGNLDNTLLPLAASVDSIVLLYRPSAAFSWTIVPFTKTGNQFSGFIVTQNLMSGQYAFGIGNPNQSDIQSYEPKKQNIMKVFPNPSNGHFTIEFETDCVQPSVKIFNSMGKQIDLIKSVQGENTIQWKPNGNPSGVYIIQLHDTRRKVMLDSRSVIYEK
jgi:hypothetical protein